MEKIKLKDLSIADLKALLDYFKSELKDCNYHTIFFIAENVISVNTEIQNRIKRIKF